MEEGDMVIQGLSAEVYLQIQMHYMHSALQDTMIRLSKSHIIYFQMSHLFSYWLQVLLYMF